MLLGAHPEVCTIGELNLVYNIDEPGYRCSCTQLIEECPFWAKVTAALARRGVEFDITDARTNFRASQSAYARRLLRPLHRSPILESIRDLGLALSPVWRKEHAAKIKNA